MMSDTRVAVIIPAHNASSTLDETLLSVRTQTHADLEIIVVDDGSTDATSRIAGWHAACDGRIRVVRQENAGVAMARNVGASQTTAPFLAFVDADDLWDPGKTEAQLKALKAAGETAGLAYTWSALIDEHGRIFDTDYQPLEQGAVVERLCRGNLVGNGSSVLVSRAAFQAAGGFDPTLRAKRAQGCEDWKFYYDVAGAFDFVLVPAFLTGYRVTPNAMSSNLGRMYRSGRLVLQAMRRGRGDLKTHIEIGERQYTRWLVGRAMAASWDHAIKFAMTLAKRRPVQATVFLKRYLFNHLNPTTPALERASSEAVFKIGKLAHGAPDCH